MNKILIIDPGKGWGQFVSKMYCYQKLANHLNSKIVFLTKKSTQAKYYLKQSSFCDEVGPYAARTSSPSPAHTGPTTRPS